MLKHCIANSVHLNVSIVSSTLCLYVIASVCVCVCVCVCVLVEREHRRSSDNQVVRRAP